MSTRAQPCDGQAQAVSQSCGLRRLPRRARRGPGKASPARLGLLHHAHPLAFPALAGRRWATDCVLALADPDAFGPLAQTPPHDRQWPRIPESLQGVCGGRGQSPFDRASLRRAQSTAGWAGAPSRGLALVQLGLPFGWRRGCLAAFAPWAGCPAGQLATVGQQATDGSGIGSHAPVGGERPTVRFGRLGANGGEALGLAVNDPAPRPATETTRRRAKGRLIIRYVPFLFHDHLLNPSDEPKMADRSVWSVIPEDRAAIQSARPAASAGRPRNCR